MPQSSTQEFWENTARRICRRINLGFWLHQFTPLLLGLAILQGFLLILLRKTGHAPALSFWLGFVIALLAAAVFALRRSRNQRFSLADGLVHLESRLHLHNRLTAARLGHANWPDPIPPPQSLRWSRPRLALPAIGAASFLLLAAWIPVGQSSAPGPVHPPEEPLAWREIEAWADLLEEPDLLDEETLVHWREQVRQLRDQPPEEWYAHGSLEAGDHLRDSALESIRHLQAALERAEYPLTLARESLDDIPSGLRPLLQEHWLETLSQLNDGTLKLSPEALAQLGEIDFTQIEGLTQEQIDRLAEMVRQGREACAMTQGQCPGGPGEAEGDCPSCGSTACAGSGGIGKGPGAADLTFSEFPTLIDSDRREAVSNPDLSRAALGQQIGTTQSEPEVDSEHQNQITPGGEIALPGSGGDAVFRSHLTPAERRRLQHYFE